MLHRSNTRACTGRALFVSICVAILFVACSSDGPPAAQLQESCLLNTDCNSPLVCAFRNCHTACASSRDCPAGARCVASDRPFHVCQLESERACIYNSNCPEGQVCGVDAECRDGCQGDADCLPGQTCVSGSCAEPSELRDGGLPVVPKDAGPSTGQPCAFNSQCPGRLVCLTGFCRRECLSSVDCKGGRQCIQDRCQVRVCPENDAGAGVACAFSSDCPAPTVCRSGSCTCECRLAADCPSSYDCIGNRCTPGGVDTIGPEGGAVVSADHRLTLEVPPNALTVPVHLTIELAEAWPAGSLGPVFDVRPSGTSFASPVTFVYRYQPDDIAPAAPEDVHLAVAEGAVWTRLPTDVDAKTATATAQTMHLSTYGLVGPESRCAAAACSGTVRDDCCPSACTALEDSDCKGCGNGRVEAGETCDPPGSCPACDDQNDCTMDTQTGSAATCDLVCRHSAKTCSNAGKDRCCPVGCTAQNDSDCAGCGDGIIDPASGETCDPPGTCPTACAPGQCWEVKTLTGSPATCNARCSTTQLACSGTASDGCCPPGCNTSPANRDVDCPGACGNGIVDIGESCDPLSSCPASCSQVVCTLRTLANAGTCQAQCQTAGTQTSCVNDDGCCPSLCNALNDNNCSPVCGNGVVEAGELCEGASCPTSCPDQACTLRALQGTMCQRRCVDAATITACTGGDNCCPGNCSAANDPDCAGCGNGRLEPGETCDPPGSCPVCDDQNDCTTDTQTGSAATCDVKCQHAAKTCSTAGKDRCCPIGCSAQNDSDCAGCGDGIIDANAGETCDPPSSCPTSCTPGQCWEIKTFTGSPATCNARCSTTPLACSGTTADQCCPPGCNTSPSNRDVDCPAACGNGIVDTGETCDPLTSCPTTCPQQGCTLRALANAGTCQAACTNSGTQTACTNGDNCCPSVCNSLNDNNCSPVCGNGVVEAGELCDGTSCPTSCLNQGCTQRTLQGTACQRQCVDSGTITSCTPDDGCCPGTCNSLTDNNCSPVCGNGVTEAGELCDGANCPTACPNIGCTQRALSGTMCQRQCVDSGTITGCANDDSCCPNVCNALNDNNCSPVCGNQVTEPPETCDGSNCPDLAKCVSDADTIRTPSGSAATCDATCTATARGCVADGFCPALCDSVNDPDCPPDNDRCVNAADISPGGSFTVDIPTLAKQDSAPACSGAGPEVFYMFALKGGSEFVYLSVLDTPVSGNAVPLAIEIYPSSCPPPDGTGQAMACDASTGGERACQRSPFPLITSSANGVLSGKPLSKGQYFLAVRALGGPGRWTLTYHHLPIECARQGEIIPPTQLSFQFGTTCGHLDESTPSCAANGEDDNYAVFKCPNHLLDFTTCDRTSTSDTMLSAVRGSMVFANGRCSPIVPDGREVACNATAPTTCANPPNAAEITSVAGNAPGILTVSVDTQKAGACGPYALGALRR